MKIKIAAKFRAPTGLRFENTKRITSSEIRPKSFGTFEKQAPGILTARIWNSFFLTRHFSRVEETAFA